MPDVNIVNAIFSQAPDLDTGTHNKGNYRGTSTEFNGITRRRAGATLPDLKGKTSGCAIFYKNLLLSISRDSNTPLCWQIGSDSIRRACQFT